MKSPVRWVGGKSKSVNIIIELMPDHYTYVEPFFGGGWILFNKEKAKVEVINDINSELMNFYETIRTNYDEFKKQFNYLIPSRELFNKWKNEDYSNLTNMERAIRFYYLNRTCFGGDMSNPIFGTSNIRRSNICSITDDFDKFMIPIHKRLKDVYIESLDYKEVFRKYDSKSTTKEKREIFFFVDPPYTKGKKYKDGFTIDDHKELSDILSSLNGKFMLTIDNSDEIKEWYKNFNIITNDVIYKICKDLKGIGSRKELIITNYDI